MKDINFEVIYESSKFLNISSIFDSIRSYYVHNGTSIEDSKLLFIQALRYFVSLDKAKIKFRNDQPRYLDKVSLSEQLNYVFNSFPNEYDENIPEKDIENLWWYFCCPVDIEWKQEDGNYYLSD